jgi:hypothetical protein
VNLRLQLQGRSTGDVNHLLRYALEYCQPHHDAHHAYVFDLLIRRLGMAAVSRQLRWMGTRFAARFMPTARFLFERGLNPVSLFAAASDSNLHRWWVRDVGDVLYFAQYAGLDSYGACVLKRRLPSLFTFEHLLTLYAQGCDLLNLKLVKTLEELHVMASAHTHIRHCLLMHAFATTDIVLSYL